MLLAIDVGNTHTVLRRLRRRRSSRVTGGWRPSAAGRSTSTASCCAMLFAGAAARASTGIAVSSVVPPMTQRHRRAVPDATSASTPLHRRPGVRTGMPILYDDPQQVGSDRIVNAVAAYRAHAATRRSWSTSARRRSSSTSPPQGEYAGGVIAPGLGIASDALFERAAQAVPRRAGEAAARRRPHHRARHPVGHRSTATSRWSTGWWRACRREHGVDRPRHRHRRLRAAARAGVGDHRGRSTSFSPSTDCA